jgi:hypothetical protein
MSATKLDTTGVFSSTAAKTAPTALTLPANAVRVRRNGIEFHAARAMPLWTEMSVELVASGDRRKFRATGIVVACSGNRHAGYRVTMLFMGLNARSEQQLNLLSFSQLS